ncbi:TetR/AcrR family transcriptional regulator [Streptacidiphilus monticola]
MVRSDARENRARILAAAREAFAEDGAASMNQIAQRAGVGAGTLYRNFPTREALVLAVYQDEVARITATVPDLLARLAPAKPCDTGPPTSSRPCARSTASATRSAPARTRPRRSRATARSWPR